jgi:hypothetical protein
MGEERRLSTLVIVTQSAAPLAVRGETGAAERYAILVSTVFADGAVRFDAAQVC